jgi:hypothetical protein
MSSNTSGNSPADVARLVRELRSLVIAYLRERTVEPLLGALRLVVFGLVGAFLMAAGTALLLLAGLRALQSETGSTFEGHLSWLPYVITAAGAIGLLSLAAKRLLRRPR